MKVHRGDIVLLDMPFSQGGGSKIRPAVVVQDDELNARLDDTTVVAVTRNLQHADKAHRVLIDIETEAGKSTGLLATSVVRCEKLFNVHHRFVLRRLGTLPPPLMEQVDTALMVALSLPSAA